MIRNLKALGLALLAMAALGSLAASGAQAAPTFNAETANEWHPTGKQIGTHKFTLPFGAELTCEEAHFDPTQTHKGSTTKTKVTPTYNKCHAIIFGTTYPVTVTHNECTYELHAEEKTAENTYKGSLKLGCPENVKGIEIHVYQAGDTEHKQAPRCTFTVKPQTVTGITFHNEAEDVVLKSNEAKVATTKTSGSLLQCGAENVTATYHGDTTVTATDTTGEVKGFVEGS